VKKKGLHNDPFSAKGDHAQILSKILSPDFVDNLWFVIFKPSNQDDLAIAIEIC